MSWIMQNFEIKKAHDDLEQYANPRTGSGDGCVRKKKKFLFLPLQLPCLLLEVKKKGKGKEHLAREKNFTFPTD